jgi:hypothetical protein
LKSAALQGRVADGVVQYQTGRLRTILAHQAAAQPAMLLDDGGQAGGVAAVDLGHPGVVAVIQGSIGGKTRTHLLILGGHGQQLVSQRVVHRSLLFLAPLLS